jgi:hypothetical protein
MVRYTKGVGLIISGDELLTEHGKAICEMSDVISDLYAELEWWRKAALGEHWKDAVNEEPF